MNRIFCKIKSIVRSVPDMLMGGYPTSGHIFVDTEEYENCKVIISECEYCGKVDISWTKQYRD